VNLEDYNLRLQILLEQSVITGEAHAVAEKAFTNFLTVVEKEKLEQAEMLFTHLPMALTRIQNGEEVEKPAPEVMKEIEQSRHFALAKEQVAFIETLWDTPLPQGEIEYLYMHYVTVLNANKTYREELR
jgi:transcriptional antiterminator